MSKRLYYILPSISIKFLLLQDNALSCNNDRSYCKYINDFYHIVNIIIVFNIKV